MVRVLCVCVSWMVLFEMSPLQRCLATSPTGEGTKYAEVTANGDFQFEDRESFDEDDVNLPMRSVRDDMLDVTTRGSSERISQFDVQAYYQTTYSDYYDYDALGGTYDDYEYALGGTVDGYYDYLGGRFGGDVKPPSGRSSSSGSEGSGEGSSSGKHEATSRCQAALQLAISGMGGPSGKDHDFCKKLQGALGKEGKKSVVDVCKPGKGSLENMIKESTMNAKEKNNWIKQCVKPKSTGCGPSGCAVQ